MLDPVTIATRRGIYWMLFLLSLAFFVTGLVFSFRGFARGSDSGFLSSSGALFEAGFLGLRYTSPLGATMAALLASLIGTVLLGGILLTFRKTVSPEIFFFSFWALSLSFECGRILVFWLGSSLAPDAAMEYASRLVLSGRYMGDLALLFSGLFAVGLRSEQPGVFAVAILAIGVSFASTVPLNTGVYEASLVLRPGYPGIDQAVGAMAALLTLANYLRAGVVTGERGYLLAGVGILLAVLGRIALETAWQPPLVILGGLLAALGSWLLISRLHAYYLWQ
jgi:hypothetical protein